MARIVIQCFPKDCGTKELLAREITEVYARIANARGDDVKVVFDETPAQSVAVGGILAETPKKRSTPSA